MYRWNVPRSLTVLITVTVLCTGACSRKPLPEADSPAAKLYAETCSGGCHIVYRPELLTAAMWKTMVARMDREMARRGMEMDERTKSEILAYLERNAGSR